LHLRRLHVQSSDCTRPTSENWNHLLHSRGHGNVSTVGSHSSPAFSLSVPLICWGRFWLEQPCAHHFMRQQQCTTKEYQPWYAYDTAARCIGKKRSQIISAAFPAKTETTSRKRPSRKSSVSGGRPRATIIHAESGCCRSADSMLCRFSPQLGKVAHNAPIICCLTVRNKKRVCSTDVCL